MDSEALETRDDVCAFLGLDGTIDVADVDTRQNVATVPLSIPLRLLFNKVYRTFASGWSTRNIPNMPAYDLNAIGNVAAKPRALLRLWDFYRYKLPSRKYPPMNPDTRSFLETVYRTRNAGLADLIGQDVAARWPYMKP